MTSEEIKLAKKLGASEPGDLMKIVLMAFVTGRSTVDMDNEEYWELLREFADQSDCRIIAKDELKKGTLCYHKGVLSLVVSDVDENFIDLNLMQPKELLDDLAGDWGRSDYTQKERRKQIKVIERLGKALIKLADTFKNSDEMKNENPDKKT